MNTNTNEERLLAAMRAKCMECSGGSRTEVQRCTFERCALHPYRMGSARAARARGVKGQMSLFEDGTHERQHA